MDGKNGAQMIERKTWNEFRDTGLFLFVNSFLQIFGWSLVYSTDKDEVYPARSKFRGFDNKSVAKAHRKLSAFMKDEADQLYKEANDED